MLLIVEVAKFRYVIPVVLTE